MTLLIPAKADPERDGVADCWSARGGRVVRLDRFWEPGELPRQGLALYGHDTFCLVLAQLLDLELVSPPDDWVLGLGEGWLGRRLWRGRLADPLTFPCFVKPLIPKQFRAAVYATRSELDGECQGLPNETELLLADPVKIDAEARGFFLNGQLKTCSVYEGQGDPRPFLESLGGLPQPPTCVIDVALVAGRWVVLEANATWGAGLNGCPPDSVIDCLKAATRLPTDR